jgi:hypothetical protein
MVLCSRGTVAGKGSSQILLTEKIPPLTGPLCGGLPRIGRTLPSRHPAPLERPPGGAAESQEEADHAAAGGADLVHAGVRGIRSDGAPDTGAPAPPSVSGPATASPASSFPHCLLAHLDPVPVPQIFRANVRRHEVSEPLSAGRSFGFGGQEDISTLLKGDIIIVPPQNEND